MAARRPEPWPSLMLTGEEGNANPTQVPEKGPLVLGEEEPTLSQRPREGGGLRGRAGWPTLP